MSCPTYSGNHLSIADALATAEQAGFSLQAAQTFVAIEQAESGLDIGAISCPNKDGSIDRGIAQINSGHNFNGYFDPLQSAQFAYALSNGGTNFTPWSTYNNGAYLAFLPQSVTGAENTMATPQPCIAGTTIFNMHVVPANPDGSCPPGAVPRSVGGSALSPYSGLEGITGPLKQIGNVFNFLTAPQSWLRIAAVLAAIGLILVGAHALLSSGSSSTINLSRAAEAAAA